MPRLELARSSRPWVTRLLVALALGSGLGLAWQVRQNHLRITDARQRPALPPDAWRAGSAGVRELEEFSNELDPLLSAPARLLVVVDPATAAQGPYVRSWMAYLRPQHLYRVPGDGPAEMAGELLLAWHTRLSDPGLEALFTSSHGALYRRRR